MLVLPQPKRDGLTAVIETRQALDTPSATEGIGWRPRPRITTEDHRQDPSAEQPPGLPMGRLSTAALRLGHRRD
jgi:hypothetical protein